jgi:4-hydroxy-tetrahydrodipicolinate synthase
LSHEEHVQVIEAAVEAANGRLKVIAGAGSNNTSEALELTKRAIEAGVSRRR